MSVDHVGIYVPADEHFEAVVTFLLASLKHLGFKEFVRPMPNLIGMGVTSDWFWIAGQGTPDDFAAAAAKMKQPHVAFKAESTQEVEEFHAAALKAGGTCNGPPGLRPHFGPGYYAAFVKDPVCGMNFEVVCKTGK